MWVARDKDESLFLYDAEPVRCKEYFDSRRGFNSIELDKKLLPKITWENSPKKVILTEESIIEEVCEWFRDNLYDTVDALGNTGIDSFDCYSVIEFIEKFKKDMKCI